MHLQAHSYGIPWHVRGYLTFVLPFPFFFFSVSTILSLATMDRFRDRLRGKKKVALQDQMTQGTVAELADVLSASRYVISSYRTSLDTYAVRTLF